MLYEYSINHGKGFTHFYCSTDWYGVMATVNAFEIHGDLAKVWQVCVWDGKRSNLLYDTTKGGLIKHNTVHSTALSLTN